MNQELKNLFIRLSTNRDVRAVLEYYEKNSLNKEDIETDFYDTIENLNSEEIDERLDYIVADNIKDINITQIEVLETLTQNQNCNDSQLKIIVKNDLSKIAIQNIIDNIYAEFETIELAISNSSAKDLYKLIENEITNSFDEDEEINPTLIYLNEEVLLKLLKQAPDNSKEQEQLLYYLTLKSDLTKETIDLILDMMKKNNIKMDMLYGEELLNQKNITQSQERIIAIFEEIPDSTVFEICLEKGLYSDEEIYDIFAKNSKHDNSIEMVLIENKTTPSTILQKIYNEVDQYSKNKINERLNQHER